MSCLVRCSTAYCMFQWCRFLRPVTLLHFKSSLWLTIKMPVHSSSVHAEHKQKNYTCIIFQSHFLFPWNLTLYFPPHSSLTPVSPDVVLIWHYSTNTTWLQSTAWDYYWGLVCATWLHWTQQFSDITRKEYCLLYVLSFFFFFKFDKRIICYMAGNPLSFSAWLE